MTEMTTTPAGLLAAVKTLAPGDVLRLAPGDYAGFTLKTVKAFDPARPIVVTSDDLANPATLNNFTLKGVQGVTFRDLNLRATAPNTRAYGFIIQDCSGIALERVKVHGSIDGDPSNDPYGVQFRGCEDVRVLGCEFTELNRGLLVGTSRRVTVRGNRFHMLRSDGMDFAQVQDVEIVENEIRDIFRDPADHPDGIQFWTSGTTAPSSDVRIARNCIERGKGGAMQGIFIRDEIGLPYERFSIVENIVVGTGWNALRVVGHAAKPSKDFTVRGNELVTFDAIEGVPTKELLTHMLLQNIESAVVTDNRAAQFGYDKVPGLQDVGNVVTKPVADLGAKALALWKGEPAPDPRDAEISRLTALLAERDSQLQAATTDRDGNAGRLAEALAWIDRVKSAVSA